VLRKVLSMDEEVATDTDSFVYDIIVNNDLVSNKKSGDAIGMVWVRTKGAITIERRASS
jgi:hypothetical protein